MKIEYDVLSGKDLKKLVEEINGKFANGWFPLEAVKPGHDKIYIQTLAKMPEGYRDFYFNLNGKKMRN